MELILFVYTLLIIILCISSSSMSFSYFLISRNRIYLFIFAIFLFYALDFSVILIVNSFELVKVENADTFYEVSVPYLRVLFGGGFLWSIWLVVAYYFNIESKSKYVMPIIIYILIYYVLYLIDNHSPMSQWVFYLPRQIFLIFCSIFCIYKYKNEKNKKKRLILSKFKILPVITIIFSVLIIIEDTVMILVIPVEFFLNQDLGQTYALYISERNFSENLLFIFYSAYCLYIVQKSLTLIYQLAPNINHDNIVLEHIDNEVPGFALKYGLTKREKEILTLVLKDFDNNQIACELFLANGTIKAHLHNIFKKTNTAGKDELIKLFWL